MTRFPRHLGRGTRYKDLAPQREEWMTKAHPKLAGAFDQAVQKKDPCPHRPATALALSTAYSTRATECRVPGVEEVFWVATALCTVFGRAAWGLAKQHHTLQYAVL